VERAPSARVTPHRVAVSESSLIDTNADTAHRPLWGGHVGGVALAATNAGSCSSPAPRFARRVRRLPVPRQEKRFAGPAVDRLTAYAIDESGAGTPRPEGRFRPVHFSDVRFPDARAETDTGVRRRRIRRVDSTTADHLRALYPHRRTGRPDCRRLTASPGGPSPRFTRPCVLTTGASGTLLLDDKGLVFTLCLGMPHDAHADDALRAVRAGLAVQAELERLGLDCAIGVATGAGRLLCRSVDRHAATTGRSAVSCTSPAGMMQAAGKGLLCTEEVADQVRRSVSLSPEKPIALKGLRVPVAPVSRPRRRDRRSSCGTPVRARKTSRQHSTHA
jgi:hypothetical protein